MFDLENEEEMAKLQKWFMAINVVLLIAMSYGIFRLIIWIYSKYG